ncbi:MAG: ribonuclease HII, partial [Aquiluna sp.]
MSFPTLEFEKTLLEKHSAVIAIDEVGRGSIAGPVAVGAFILTKAQLTEIPAGLQDSKLVKENKRGELADRVRMWGKSSVSFVSAKEIDDHGIIRALQTAGKRCLEELVTENAVVLLDGNQNWLQLSGV